MTDDFWGRVRVAYDAGADAPPAERAAAIVAASGGDAAVQREATAMLDAQADSFLEGEAAFGIDRSVLDAQLARGTGVAGARIVGLVGRGGMGEVYDAIRVGPGFEKRVAIKVLRAGATHADAVRRFERERRILAGLQHPNIASLIDGGVLPDGRPFLVMEFVEGERITDWCAARRLDSPARLALFRQMASAVSYAHRNLIVHRDLKPGNILVASDGTVKLLDFGIAKVLDDEPADGDAATRPGSVALTPEYAAPEQLTSGNVTTATDVYALGLLLFELLTGRRPFAESHRSLPDLTRAVLTTAPPLPSGAVSHAWQGGAVERARRELRGDLDAIILKALRPDATERYASVDEMLVDIACHDAGLPVGAMRGHRGYRVRKFVGRNRAAVIGVSLVVVALAAGEISTLREARHTAVQRARAEATANFLTGMLASVDPAAEGKEVPMVQLLDTAAARISRDSAIEPEVEASLRSAIGLSYHSLGKFDLAAPHLQRALEIRLKNESSPVLVATAYRDLAAIYDDRGEYPKADTIYRKAVAALAGARDSAAKALSVDLLEQLARIQSMKGELVEAEKTLRDVVDRKRRIYGDSSDQAAKAFSQLGVTLLQEHKYAPAESAARTSVVMLQRLHDRPHPDLGRAAGRLATVLELSGNRAAADTAYRASLKSLVAALGPQHPDVAWIRYNYAGFLMDGKEWRATIVQADSILAYRGVTIPETHNTIAGVIQFRAAALGALGDLAGEERGLRESLGLRRKYLGPTHWLVGSSESALGEQLARQGKKSEAMQLLLDGCIVVAKALGPDHPNTKKTHARFEAAGGTGSACSS